MSMFSVYLLSSEVDELDVKTSLSGKPILSLYTKDGDSRIILTDNDGRLAATLRQAADMLDAHATPELWATA